jgi:hypothetical protein
MRLAGRHARLLYEHTFAPSEPRHWTGGWRRRGENGSGPACGDERSLRRHDGGEAAFVCSVQFCSNFLDLISIFSLQTWCMFPVTPTLPMQSVLLSKFVCEGQE